MGKDQLLHPGGLRERADSFGRQMIFAHVLDFPGQHGFGIMTFLQLGEHAAPRSMTTRLLQYDVFQTAEEVDAFFTAGSHVENFMGVIFDPDDMAARFEAGEPLGSLTQRPPLLAGPKCRVRATLPA